MQKSKRFAFAHDVEGIGLPSDLRQNTGAFGQRITPPLVFEQQILSLQVSNGDDALAKFRSNRFAGVLVALACAVIGSTA